MGFQPPRKTYILDFEGTELDGLEVKARSAPLGMMLELGKLADGFGSTPDVEEIAGLSEQEQISMVRGSMDSLRSIVELYAQVLVSWNYEDEHGQAVPATVEGMLTLDPPHMMMIIQAWRQAVVAVPPASSPTSSAGALSEVPPLPMAPLSTGLAS